MSDEEKDLGQIEDAPRRRQRIVSRDTERVYSASQDQGERFDTIETERYIKRVIQSRSKEELIAALRALKEQATPKKKRGRPSKRDQEEQRILMETIERHMDEINATRAALTGDVSGTPIDIFGDDPLLDSTSLRDGQEYSSAETAESSETSEEFSGTSAESAGTSAESAGTSAESAEINDDLPDFIRMQQHATSPSAPVESAESIATQGFARIQKMAQSTSKSEKDEAGESAYEENRSASLDNNDGRTTLAMLYAQGIDFHIVQDIPRLTTFDLTEDAAPQAEPAPQRDEAFPDYLARTRSFLSKAGVPMSNRQQQPVRNFEAAPAKPEREITIVCEGVLDLGDKDKQGVLRSSDYNYLASPDDVFISLQQIRQFALKRGDVVRCKCRPPRAGETKYVFLEPITINGLEPNRVRDRVNFEHLTPLFPDSQFVLSRQDTRSPLSCRIVDLFAPIGKGQRALIVAQPKTGKTVLMKQIANAIAANYPETYLMMLLIDERPEEVTDMSRTVNAEVIASTFDESASNHTRIAQIVLEKAKRMVECGRDVVIFLDSITRLARAFNAITPMSGRILTGGVDANALQMPKRFFGAARNIEGGGSLTIIATALIDTGSKMDEVIFEEFKGTGNMELLLDRNLANKRIFPAVNLIQSSTRREDLLLDEQTVNRMFVTRNYMADMSPVEAMNFLKRRLEDTVNNEEFIATINR